MPLLQQESKEQSRMPTGGGKPPTDSEAVNLRKGLFVGPTECPNRTLRTRAPSEARIFRSKVGERSLLWCFRLKADRPNARACASFSAVARRTRRDTRGRRGRAPINAQRFA